MVWWKAVSKTPTMGTPGRTACAALMPSMLAGLCSGASGTHSSSAATTSASMIADHAYFSPACTTRCPTAAISCKLRTTPCSGSLTASVTSAIARTWSGTGASNTRLSLPVRW